ncbi:hypothetical protein IDSA_00910 [Pseudidiomarina salinarum]|uniref:Cytoskeleton protein RodZ-like C-terminal domain-containing protein n=1 Tax=Pseudidiomarina salinarum TaxID=435908 RepID=A0A094IUH5_9GAMM|nr:RodZ domain-containing protein [Pseudidiomarina salinarum]KFZ31325.1 hypothetical protein IDSA_00910 [Pseudidiomarina salinarum]RUO70922.1 DUF4115 domain-containing protein [Pseudidiomarina salinarum]
MTADKDLFTPQDAEQEQDAKPKYTGTTPGQLLRAAREEKGLTTQQVADSLRLRFTIIDMIEADEYEKLAAPAFVRGYLRSFAKAVEADLAEVLHAYEQMGYGASTKPNLSMQSFSKRQVLDREDSRLKWFSYLIIAIVLALAVIWWWQDSDFSMDSIFGSGSPQSDVARGSTTGETRNRIEITDRSDDSVTLPETRGGTTGYTPVGVERIPESEVSAADVSTAEVVPEPVIISPTPVPSADIPGSTPADVSATDDPAVEAGLTDVDEASLALTFSDSCWIKVTDATGEDIAIGVKQAGYHMPLTGQPPFDIILCKPEAVELTYQGEEIDLSAYRRNRSVTLTLN